MVSVSDERLGTVPAVVVVVVVRQTLCLGVVVRQALCLGVLIRQALCLGAGDGRRGYQPRPGEPSEGAWPRDASWRSESEQPS